MEQSTLVAKGSGELNLTPGEQRILSLMEQGQRHMEQRMDRMEQRMQSMEDKLDAQSHQLTELALKVEYEAGASKTRDRQLAEDIQSLRDEAREREARLMEYVNKVAPPR